MADFTTAVNLVLTQEGGVVDDPSDAGGVTNFGISQRAFPNINVRLLTRADAIAIYKENYWQYDNVQSQQLANLLLSLTVNMGKAGAIRLLQRSLGISAMEQDGTWGPFTEHICNASPTLATQEFAAQAIRQYFALGQGGQEIYVLGWVRRVVECLVN